MPSVTATIRRTGAFSIERGRALIQMAAISAEAARALLRLTFLNRACYAALVRQVDETAVRALPAVCAVALVFGSVTVHYLLSILTGLGAYDRIGDYLIDSTLHVVAPVSVTLILMLRSGTATIAELGTMKIRGELDVLASMGVDLGDYVFLPRLAAFAIAGPCLTLAFCLVGLVGGFLVLGYFQDITLANYLDQITEALVLGDLGYVTVKPLLMSCAVGVIALQRGMAVQTSLAELPRLLIRGLLYALAFVTVWEIVFSFVDW